MTTILQGYVDMQGRPIENCTFVINATRQPAWDLQDDDHDTLDRCAKILTLAAFCKNDYNMNLGCYANSTHFQFVRQRFTIPVDFITYSTRRRDGSTSNGGYRHGQIHFPVPAQATTARNVCIDKDLGNGVIRALEANSQVANRLVASLLFFQLANSDSDLMQFEPEVNLMGSAFEQLLETYGANQLGEKLEELLQPYAQVTVDEGMRSRPGIVKRDPAQEGAWPVHRKWAQEFYHLRNAYTHGNDLQARTWGWQPLEHLVMAAFVFPLLVKVLLAHEGHYTLTEDDEGMLNAIDKLLAVTGWAQRVNPNRNETGWQETLWEAKRAVVRRRVVQQAVAEFGRQDGQAEEG